MAEPFALTRLGQVMAPDRADPREAEGVLNPAVARGPDGELYLFPRLVGRGNYSRIGLARVRFDQRGDPAGVERLGIALEPQEPYECNPLTGGGCEDPRVTYLEHFGCYLMTYTAYGPAGPRIALASSRDLRSWQRLGLVGFADTAPVDFNGVANKDAVLFPAMIADPEGRPSMGLIHRPLFPGSQPHEMLDSEDQPDDHRPRLHRESLWISYAREPSRLEHLVDLRFHHRLLSPRYSWERLKVGAGAPPLLTRHGWLLIYHGVSGRLDNAKKRLRYSAGALVLDRDQPHEIVYRSRRPILAPDEPERAGLVPNVVFPTGIDQRTDIGRPDRVDVYYGVSDDRIAVARLRIPARLTQAAADRQRDAAA